MRRVRVFTDDEADEIRAVVAQVHKLGLTPSWTNLARRFNTSTATVIRVVRREGVYMQEVQPDAKADTVIDNRDFERPHVLRG